MPAYAVITTRYLRDLPPLTADARLGRQPQSEPRRQGAEAHARRTYIPVRAVQSELGCASSSHKRPRHAAPPKQPGSSHARVCAGTLPAAADQPGAPLARLEVELHPHREAPAFTSARGHEQQKRAVHKTLAGPAERARAATRSSRSRAECSTTCAARERRQLVVTRPEFVLLPQKTVQPSTLMWACNLHQTSNPLHC